MCKKMDDTVKDLRELIRIKEELEAEIEAAKDAVKAYMAENGTDVITGLDYKVTWKKVESSRLDTRALKKDLPEIASKYMKKSVSRRFLIA